MAKMVVPTALVFLLLAPAVLAKDIKVGGDAGWTNAGVDYAEWAKTQTFLVGDTLVFEYGPTHVVDEVSKSGYDNCDPTGGEQFNDGNTKIKLEKTGPMYFICSTPGHCPPMKLAINVQDASSPPSGGGGSPPSSGTSPNPPPASGSEPSNPSPPGNEGGKRTVNLGIAAAATAAVLGLVIA